MQRHLYEHFQLPGHTGLLQDNYVTLTDKTDPTAPTKCEDYQIHTLKTKTIYCTNNKSQLLYKYFFSWIWRVCFRTTLGLFGLLLQLFYFMILCSTCTFLASEMEFFMAVVNDVNLVTIATDSSQESEIHYLLLFLLIVTVITYSMWHYQLHYYLQGITVTINYLFI